MRIVIARIHDLAIDAVRARITALVLKLASEYGIRGSWHENSMEITGSGASAGVTGKIDVTASSVSLVIDLPLLLSFLRGGIEKSVSQSLDEALGG